MEFEVAGGGGEGEKCALSMMTIHMKMLQSPDVRAGEIRVGR